MRRGIDPIAEALAAKPLAPARNDRQAVALQLSDLNVRDLADLVLEKVNHCRTRRDQAHTGRRRAIAEERLRHWWSLYNVLIDARGD